MPKSRESVNVELNDLLTTKGFKVKPLSSSGENAVVPEKAEAFEFNFKSGDKNYGTVDITIDDQNNMIVYYNTEVTRALDEDEDNGGWVQFVRQLKNFAIRRGLKMKLDDLDNIESDMATRDHNRKLDEGYYGTRQTSYSDNGPAAIKMIIKHNKALDENDARYRYVERIFLENEYGERVLVPSTRPGIGRIFARHLAEGGLHNDERWKHISEIVEDAKKLGGFVRATKTKQFNESVQRIVLEATEHYKTLRENLKRLQSVRGYNNYFESWQPTLMEDSDDSSLIELFKNSSVDIRIENALPVLNKLNLTITETSDMSMFEDWANNILDEMLTPDQPGQRSDLVELLGPDSEFMALGPDAKNAIGELNGLIENDKLYSRLRRAATRDTNRDARSIIIAWMSEQRGDEYHDILDQIEPQSDTTSKEPAPAPEEPESPPPVSDEEPEEEPEEEPDPSGMSQIPALSGGNQVKEQRKQSKIKRVQDNSKWVDPNIKTLKNPMELSESLERIKRLSGL